MFEIKPRGSTEGFVEMYMGVLGVCMPLVVGGIVTNQVVVKHKILQLLLWIISVAVKNVI